MADGNVAAEPGSPKFMTGRARPSATQVTPSSMAGETGLEGGPWTTTRGDPVGDNGATCQVTQPMEERPPQGFSQVPGYMAGTRGSWTKRADTLVEEGHIGSTTRDSSFNGYGWSRTSHMMGGMVR